MTGESWKIYWNEYAKDAFIYGSEIIFHAKDDIEYKNELMPPGTVIKKWFSKVNYQMMRIKPSLPMIDAVSYQPGCFCQTSGRADLEACLL